MKRVPYILVAILLMAGLVVMAGCGGGGTSDDGIPPNDPPIASAGGEQSVQVGGAVSFGGTGTDAGGSIVKYEWDFDGDGVYDWSSETAGSATHVYSAAGTYTAVLRVTDNNGATDIDTITITVSPETVDISGTWSGNWSRSDGGEVGTMIAIITQIGGSLSGDMTVTSTTFPSSKETTVSGSVEGNDVVFGIAISTNGETVTIDYVGTISEDGDQMSGTYSISTGYTGTWNATRQ